MDIRTSHAYKTARRRWLATAARTCHWCGRAVSDDLPAGHRAKATVDHTLEVDRNPTLALDTRLWVVACWECNSRRGSRYWHDNRAGEHAGLGETSRDW